MSAQEIEAAAQAFIDAFNRLDVPAMAEALDEDIEVFDHVPFRFDNKKQVVNYIKEGLGRLESNSYSFRQLSCRVFNDTTGIANAHDSWTSVTKDGKVQTLHGRATLVFVKRGNQWKIVSSHFSPLPHA